MAGNEYFPTRPRAAQDRTKIAAGSPLALVGLILEALRERFSEGNGIEEIWTDREPPVWRDDVGTTGILIEAGYNEELEARNFGCALYVNRLNTVPTKLVLGNRAGVHLPDHMEGFMCMVGSQFTIDCVSNDEGMSSILADIVQSFLIAGSQIFCGWYGIHDFGLAQMGQTQPFSHDQQKWSTSVSFEISYQARWSTVKIRPLLQDITTRVLDGGVAEHHEAVATASLSRGGVGVVHRPGSVTGYTHVQNTPSNMWLVNHELGYFPTISVVDTAGYVIYPVSLRHMSPYQAVLGFEANVAGTARAV